MSILKKWNEKKQIFEVVKITVDKDNCVYYSFPNKCQPIKRQVRWYYEILCEPWSEKNEI